MKGLFITAPGKLEILEMPIPEPGPFEALVKTEACAICNSTDTKVVDGEFVSGTWPVLLGHEDIGSVVKVGSGVRSFKLGDRVLRGTLPDAQIPFPGGRSCWGGFVEYNLVTDVWAKAGVEYNAFPHPQQIVPASIKPAEASLLITLKENLSVVSNFDVVGRTLAIVGTGPVAQSMTLFARYLGARTVVVFGRNPAWKERMTRLGADVYVTGAEAPAEVNAILKGGGFERVLEAVGSRAALSHCIQLAGKVGKVGIYGIPSESEPYAAQDMKNPAVSSPKVAEAEVHDQLLALVQKGQVKLAEWVSQTLPWQEFALGFDRVRRKEANKVVLMFS
jgi:threonine dehydrogenase-like Zn-dependent dehydrogenase